MKRTSKLIILLLLFCLFALRGVNAQTPPDQQPVEKTYKTGDMFPDIAFQDTTGVERHISQFLGKYVYIDTWNSRCAPCIKQLPNLEDMKERLKGKNIVILSIGLETYEWRWKGALQYHKMTGHQWLAPNNSFEEAFQIHYIPRFILIGPDGHIINDKMTSPSKPETLEYLLTIL